MTKTYVSVGGIIGFVLADSTEVRLPLTTDDVGLQEQIESDPLFVGGSIVINNDYDPDFPDIQTFISVDGYPDPPQP